MSAKDDILTHVSRARDYLTTKRDKWDEYENLFHGILSDQASQRTKSQMFDGKLATLVLEREARVMAQLGVGKVKPISKNDIGAGRLMNLTLEKYVLPNANSQFDFLTKCRMVDRYSNIYGNYFVMVDWDVRKSGYVGPDMWLLNIRDVFPQVGAISLDDSQRIVIRTWQPIEFFENLPKDGYKNVDKIVKLLKDKAGKKGNRDSEDKDRREDDEYPDESSARKSGYYEVFSMYERDHWVEMCTDADNTIFRDSKNPHDDDELPVFNKYSIPLISDFMAMGDMERGEPHQKLINSLWNLYLDSVKVSLFPPVMLNKDMIADQSSIKFGPAAKWLLRGNLQNAAQVFQLSPQGTQTFNNVYQVANASLLNLFGTSDTAVTESTDPGFGKTPQALKMQAMRENARDNVDRYYMEAFLTKVMKKMVNLVSKKMPKTVTVRLFGSEIEELAKSYPEIREMYDNARGEIKIPRSKAGSILYDYELVSNSTYAVDQKAQQENLMNLISMFTQNMAINPQTGEAVSPMIAALKAEGKDFKLGEAITRSLANSGIQDWDKIIVDQEQAGEGTNDIANEQDAETILQGTEAIFNQAVSQMGGIGGIPEQPMGEEQPIEMGGMDGTSELL